MAAFEELRVLKAAEEIADSIWRQVIQWDEFPRDVVGKQLMRAVDSIGANIAEACGHFHFGEKLQFLYYARGSLFETKYWLNRVLTRELMAVEETQIYIDQLTSLARQLNAFAEGLKEVRSAVPKQSKTLREAAPTYQLDLPDDLSNVLFADQDLDWLSS